MLTLASSSANDRFLPLLALTLLLTVGVALILRRLRLPALPGFFICGFILARTGLIDLSEGSTSADLLVAMGDVGVVLLMFSIGAECSLHELKQLKQRGLKAGLLQVGLTTCVFAAGVLIFGLPLSSALLLGLIATVSSTAVGVRLFDDCGVPGHPASRTVLGIALVQDIIVIFTLLLLPGLAGGGDAAGVAGAAGLITLKSLIFVAAAWVLSRWGIPQLLRAVSRTRARDLFTLTVLAVCAGIAAMGQWLGAGVSIGAFAAGVAVSGSLYRNRILADAAPFKDFFLTLFFLSVGALVSPAALADHWLLITALTLTVLALKTALTTGAVRATRCPVTTGLLAGAALSGVGEFAIVLAREGVATGLLTGDMLQIIFAVAALSLSLSPIVMKLVVPPVLRREAAHPAAAPGKKKSVSISQRVKEMQDHAILCGYGTVGEVIHKGLTRLGIPTVIIELNADTVATLLKKGHPVLFADIAQADTLELAGIARARILILSFPNAEAARATITIAKERNPDILTFCRARWPHEAAMLRELAPDNVVHDEMEAGLKMLRLCARAYEPVDGAV
jgi:monovalent cation:H+ antiporter-2, CPA2 family